MRKKQTRAGAVTALTRTKDSAPPGDWSGVRSLGAEPLPRVGEAAADSERDLDELTGGPTRVNAAIETERQKLRMTLNLAEARLPVLHSDTGAERDDYDDEATEVAPWSRFIRLPDEAIGDRAQLARDPDHAPRAPGAPLVALDCAPPVARVTFSPKRGADLASIAQQLRARLRRTPLLVIAGGAVLLVTVVVGLLALRHLRPERPDPAAATAPASND